MEKSELSIRLAEKMDDMDRAWEWFTNRLIRICIQKVRYLSGRVENETVRFHLRMAYKFLYYLALLIPCWLLTRDNLTHSWFDHFGWRDIYMDVLVPEWRKHVYECGLLLATGTVDFLHAGRGMERDACGSNASRASRLWLF